VLGGDAECAGNMELGSGTHMAGVGAAGWRVEVTAELAGSAELGDVVEIKARWGKHVRQCRRGRVGTA
jgi:hypothetical protein